MKTAELIKKYQSYISNIEWHIKTNNPPEDAVLREQRRVECYSEIVKDLQKLESSASQPMSAEQVEELYNQWCKETKRNGSVLVGGSMFEFFTWLKSTAPTVKADGWVSVEEFWNSLTDEQRLQLRSCKGCGSLDTSCQCWNDE